MKEEASIKIKNWINGRSCDDGVTSWFDKHNPHSEELLCEVANSPAAVVGVAVNQAQLAFFEWSDKTPIERGKILFEMAKIMKEESKNLAENIAVETGKPPGDAEGEVGAAIMQAEFFAGEGMRLHGKSLTSSMHGKSSYTVREAHGVVGLIVPANTPIANISWKIFPALICGNSIVLKAAEDAPTVAIMIAKIAQKAGLPNGVLNVVQGLRDTGVALVENKGVSLISFTGSTAAGKEIAKIAGSRLARVSLELGGKNALVVCDDADIDLAVYWASMSAFSNAGQRCAAASRILVFRNVYDEFIDKFVNKAKSLKLGITEGCDLGPVINEKQHRNILQSLKASKNSGGEILCGESLEDESSINGYYIHPTVIVGLNNNSEINVTEIFGPVATVQVVDSLQEALEITNDSQYGLTSAIHTKNVDRAMWFAKKVRSGVVNINIGTFGSEPHMPFGGFGSSGNGSREPGIEALDVYSELKNISFLTRQDLI